jgi:hypothetical protein
MFVLYNLFSRAFLFWLSWLVPLACQELFTVEFELNWQVGLRSGVCGLVELVTHLNSVQVAADCSALIRHFAKLLSLRFLLHLFQ